jgi:hypothetical protein
LSGVVLEKRDGAALLYDELPLGIVGGGGHEDRLSKVANRDKLEGRGGSGGGEGDQRRKSQDSSYLAVWFPGK